MSILKDKSIDLKESLIDDDIHLLQSNFIRHSNLRRNFNLIFVSTFILSSFIAFFDSFVSYSFNKFIIINDTFSINTGYTLGLPIFLPSIFILIISVWVVVFSWNFGFISVYVYLKKFKELQQLKEDLIIGFIKKDSGITPLKMALKLGISEVEVEIITLKLYRDDKLLGDYR